MARGTKTKLQLCLLSLQEALCTTQYILYNLTSFRLKPWIPLSLSSCHFILLRPAISSNLTANSEIAFTFSLFQSAYPIEFDLKMVSLSDYSRIFIYLFSYLLTKLLTYLLNHSPTHSIIYSLTHSLTQLLTHFFN